jgi:hypothetical protein
MSCGKNEQLDIGPVRTSHLLPRWHMGTNFCPAVLTFRQRCSSWDWHAGSVGLPIALNRNDKEIPAHHPGLLNDSSPKTPPLQFHSGANSSLAVHALNVPAPMYT